MSSWMIENLNLSIEIVRVVVIYTILHHHMAWSEWRIKIVVYVHVFNNQFNMLKAFDESSQHGVLSPFERRLDFSYLLVVFRSFSLLTNSLTLTIAWILELNRDWKMNISRQIDLMKFIVSDMEMLNEN